VAEDCVIDYTQPALRRLPQRWPGRACTALWTVIATRRGRGFESEDPIVLGKRGIILWRYHLGLGRESSVRGVNLVRVREGRIVEALGYVKGA
jgi:hypothetical protein